MKKTLFFCTIAVVLLTACSDNGLFPKEKQYTPLYVYYNPLPLIIPETYGFWLFSEEYYPTFVNYPDDRSKHGLRGNVSLVQYPNNEYIFDTKGKLKVSSSFADEARKYIELREFRHDIEGHLIGIYRNSHKDKWASNREKFEYDSIGQLKSRHRVQKDIYSYYDDGTLKEIARQLSKTQKKRMEFDTFGDLVKWEREETTSNPFMRDANCQSSICTFTHTNGLCTEMVEKIIFKNDTVVCKNYFTYNEKGDLTTWGYSGGVINSQLREKKYNGFFEANLKISFEYEYDSHSNWTTMRIIFPERFEQIEYLVRCGRGQPVMTYHRNIEYHAFSAKEERELKKKNAPKFTAVQGHGLYGDVKKVSGSHQEMIFDEYGNILYNGYNHYVYNSPTQYMIDSAIGPFRITCEGNIRKEEDEKGIEGTIEYEFDKRERVIRHRYSPSMHPITETYTYNGREKHPATITSEVCYEDGCDKTTCKYSYMEFDKQGNWTKRKVQRIVTSTTYEPEEITTKTEPEFIETRTITYYN